MSRHFNPSTILLSILILVATVTFLYLGKVALAQGENLRLVYMACTFGLLAIFGVSSFTWNWHHVTRSLNVLRPPPLNYEGYYTTALHQKNRVIEDLLRMTLSFAELHEDDPAPTKRLANLYFTHYLGLHEFCNGEYDWKRWATGAIKHGPVVGKFLRKMCRVILDQGGRVYSYGRDGSYYEHEVPLRIPDHLRVQLEQYVNPKGPAVMTRDEAYRHLQKTFGA